MPAPCAHSRHGHLCDRLHHPAAFCHMNGYGTNKSLDKARALFIRASNKFAHMGSRWELGNMLIRGEGGARDVPTARFLLTDAASKGAWGGAVRDVRGVGASRPLAL